MLRPLSGSVKGLKMKICDMLFIVSVDVIETYYMENPIKRNEIHIVDAKDNNEVQQKIPRNVFYG